MDVLGVVWLEEERWHRVQANALNEMVHFLEKEREESQGTDSSKKKTEVQWH